MALLMLNVFGGLAIFIFGMKLMSDGLQKAAGERMRSILRFFAANRFVAILSGTLVTAVIQSSSASTVMVIGFVNAGLLNLVQATGIIFGANIGTTVTAQLVAFKVDYLIMPAIIAGLLLSFLPRAAWRVWGETVIGFGFLFFGMNIMSGELEILAESPAFMSAFSLFDCAPVGGWLPPGAVLGAIGIGLAATMIIQSSSACTGIIIALGAGGIINLYTAVALTLGSNIGTTVTAQLAAIPANRVAKQAALAHTLFNVIGVALMASTFWLRLGGSEAPVFFRLINWISGDSDLPRHIANAHTVFNVCTTLVLAPFIPLLAKVCRKLIPVRERQVRYQYLEPHLLNTPPIAVDQAKKALEKMFGLAWEMTDSALRKHFMAGGNDPAGVRRLDDMEEEVDRFQLEITEYLTRLTYQQLREPQASAIPLIIHCVNDAERIGDRARNILSLTGRQESMEGKLSDAAVGELAELSELLTIQARAAEQSLHGCDPAAARTAGEMEETIIGLTEQYEFNHVDRLSRNDCSAVIGITFVEVLSEIRDISRHIANIAERAVMINGPRKAG